MSRPTPTRRSPRGRVILVLGGASSGKSAAALSLAAPPGSRHRPRVLLATAQARDAEMDEKIRRHRAARAAVWRTEEVPVDLVGWFEKRGPRFRAVVVDCLTLWLSNLLGHGLREAEALGRTRELLRVARDTAARVVLVSNELGLGLVPPDPASRRFRDLAGRVNQMTAREADDVFLIVSGIPLKLK